MNCFLCLEGSDVFFNTCDEFQQDAYNFSLIEPIAKYFSFKPTTESASICETCFNIITPFHIFCLQIEETHNKVIALKEKLNAEAKKSNDLNVSNENNDNKYRKNKKFFNNLSDDSDHRKLDILKSKQSEIEKKLDANIIPKEEIDIGDTELVDFNAAQNDTFDNKITFSEYNSPNTLPILRQEDYSANQSFNENDSYIDNNLDQYNSIFNLNKNRMLAKRMKLKNKNKIRDKRRKERTDWYINRKISKFMKLNCDICNNEISSFKALQKHFECNHGESGYAICCGEKFYKRYLLVHHIDFHLASNNFKSNLAIQKNIDKLNMVENYNNEYKEIKEKLQCNQCDKTFSRIWTLKQHQAYHTPKETWKFKCEDCKKTLPTHCHLNSHIYFAHKEKFIQCHVCFKRLRAAHLNKHLKNHPKNEKEKSDNERSYNDDDEQSQSEYEKFYGNTQSDIDEQMFVEEDIKHFACSTCSELFNSEEDLDIHINNEHTQRFIYTKKL